MATIICSDYDFSGVSRVTGLPTPSNPSDAATKAYVDTFIGSPLKPPTNFNASTNPNYPASSAGDTYLVTVAGKIGGASGLDVNVGDLVICKTTSISGDQSSVGANFFILESNRSDSTETTKGVVQIATQAETNSGVDDTKAITPLKLKTHLDSRSYSALIGNGIDSTFTVTHGLGSSAPIVQVYLSASPFEQAIPTIKPVSSSTVELSFTSIPTTAQYTVTIRK